MNIFQRKSALAVLATTLFLAVTLFISTENPAPASASTPAETASAAAPDPFAGITLLAKAAFVQDLATGKILYSLHPDTQLPLASITKVPLAIVVSEAMPADAKITIPRDTAPPGSMERLGSGEVWRVRDVLDFTLVASSNGGAEILAEAAAPEIRARNPEAPLANATIWRMNQLAKDLNLSHTYFLNASGLDMSATEAGSYSSARDVATLFAYAARNWPEVFSQTARDNLTLTSVDGIKTTAYNTDEVLGSFPGLVMGKTGYTDLAGGNLAIVFEVGPSRPVVAVVLGSTIDGRFSDMKKLVADAQEAIANE